MHGNAAFETSCPVPLELLALLLRCDEVRLGATVAGLAEPQRAALAIYCFERYHMRRLGFAVALHCSIEALEAAGGAAGRHVLEQARNAGESAAARPHCAAAKPVLARAA